MSRARGRLLVVDDEDYVRRSLTELITSRGYEVEAATSGAQALEILAHTTVDVVLSDLSMPGMDGQELTVRIRELYPQLPVIILTGHGTIASAVACVRAGATDYLLKPADPGTLELALGRAMEAAALRREVDYLRHQSSSAEGDRQPVGESALWRSTMREVRAAAGSEATILLTGESGTGKEVVARLVHSISPRANGPFVRVNCAATPLEMWESEFFGHRRGAFTGAHGDRDGRFRLADGGTLLMDEIGAMPLEAQAKILRVLEDGRIERLGDHRPTEVDVRIVASTNSDLETDVEEHRFRQDLFYRLNVVRIHLPPLRDRVEDIPLLARYFVEDLSRRQGRRVPEISDEVRDELAAYSWPGNVRELRNVIERALILNPGGSLSLPDLPYTRARTPVPSNDPGSNSLNLREELSRRERDVLVEALRRSGGVRKEAARLLGIDQRNLPYYLKKHAVDPDRPG